MDCCHYVCEIVVSVSICQNFEQAAVCNGILVGVGFSAPAIHIDGGNQLDVVVIPSGVPP